MIFDKAVVKFIVITIKRIKPSYIDKQDNQNLYINPKGVSLLYAIFIITKCCWFLVSYLHLSFIFLPSISYFFFLLCVLNYIP